MWLAFWPSVLCIIRCDIICGSQLYVVVPWDWVIGSNQNFKIKIYNLPCFFSYLIVFILHEWLLLGLNITAHQLNISAEVCFSSKLSMLFQHACTHLVYMWWHYKYEGTGRYFWIIQHWSLSGFPVKYFSFPLIICSTEHFLSTAGIMEYYWCNFAPESG